MTRFPVTFNALLAEAALISVCLAATFPAPSGPFNTSLTISQLTNYGWLDPYSSTPIPRSLVLSVFRPAICNAAPTPYMDHLTAAWVDAQLAQFGVQNGTFESLYLQTCPQMQHECQQDLKDSLSELRQNKGMGIYPLLLFSPGLGDPRLYFSALAQEVASRGYVVVTIDHPYDAGIVVYPDNSTVFAANITSDEEVLFDVSVRVKDVSFVLDQLSHPSTARSIGLGFGCDTTRVGMFGHSLGGATAAQAMLDDPRIRAGINLDGSFYGSVVEAGLSKPFLLFAHEGKNITSDPTWDAIWPKLKGFKEGLQIRNSTHGTFPDFLAIIDVLGLKGKLPPEVTYELGTIDGMRAMEILGTYIGAFFDKTLKGKNGELLKGPNKEFPEVTFGNVVF